MPYKEVVLALEFFERESERASRRGASRRQTISLEEAIEKTRGVLDCNLLVVTGIDLI